MRITLLRLPDLRPQLLGVALLARAQPVQFFPTNTIEGVAEALSQHANALKSQVLLQQGRERTVSRCCRRDDRTDGSGGGG